MPLKGIVFDLDGTLIDSISIWIDSWEYAFSQMGYKVPRSRIAKYIGPQDYTVLNCIGNVPRKVSDELWRFGDEYIDKNVRRVRFKRGARAVLAYAKKRGLKVAIATSSDRKWRQVVDRGLHIEDYCDYFVTTEDVKEQKPSTESFEKAFRHIGVDPHDGMVVGDSKLDMLPGRKLGAVTVMLDESGAGDGNADFVVRSLVKLKGIIAEML